MLLKVTEHLIQGPMSPMRMFNEDPRAAIGKYDELLNLVKKMKLRWLATFQCVRELGLNILHVPKNEVIRRRDFALKSHPKDHRSRGSHLRSLDW